MYLVKVHIVLVSAVLAVKALQNSSDRHNQLHSVNIRHQPLIPLLGGCRWVCDNDGNGTSTMTRNNGSSENPLEPPTTIPSAPLNFSNLGGLGENSSSIGILLNKTGGFNGYINKIFHLSDIIEGFPNSSGVLWSSLENLRNNQNLQLLLHLIGVSNGTFASENRTLYEWLNRSNIQPSQWQEIYQRLPFLSGIFSTPFDTVFQPFPFNMSTFSDPNNNSSEGFSRLVNSYSQLPYLSGIFMRPQEVWSRLQGLNGEWQNYSSIFFGPEGGYDVWQRIFNRTLSRGNALQLPTIAPSFLNNFPILDNIAKQWNGNVNSNPFAGWNSGTTPSISDIANILSGVREALNSQSAGSGDNQGPFTVHDWQNFPGSWLGNNAFANMTQWYNILNSLSSTGGPYNEEIANFFNHRSLPNVSSGISDLNHLLDIFEGGFLSGFSSMSTPSFLNILNGVRTIFNNGALSFTLPPSFIKEGRVNGGLGKHYNKEGANSKIGGLDINHRTGEKNAISKDQHQSGKHSATENLKLNKHQQEKHAKVNMKKSPKENSHIIGERKSSTNVKAANDGMGKQKSRHGSIQV